MNAAQWWDLIVWGLILGAVGITVWAIVGIVRDSRR